jgi:hypothetical protein
MYLMIENSSKPIPRWLGVERIRLWLDTLNY